MTKYIGLDGHSKNCFFVVIDKNGKILDRVQTKTSEEDILRFVRSIEGRKELATEETNLAQWFFILLKEEVDKLVICNPYYLSRRQGSKDDFKDAFRLAEDLRCNSDNIKPVFHEHTKLFELRKVVSAYNDITQDLTRSKNRYKALFRSEAIETKGETIYSDFDRINRLPNPMDQFVAKNLYDQIQYQTEIKDSFEEKFKTYANQFTSIKKLCSIPGIRAIRGCQIMAIVCSPHRFQNKHKFWGYSKLVRYWDLSDGVVYGKRQARGRLDLKSIFIGAMMSTMQGDSSFRKLYDRLRSKGVSDKDAKRAVTRKIAAVVLSVLKTGKKYDDKYEEAKLKAKKNN